MKYVRPELAQDIRATRPTATQHVIADTIYANTAEDELPNEVSAAHNETGTGFVLSFQRIANQVQAVFTPIINNERLTHLRSTRWMPCGNRNH